MLQENGYPIQSKPLTIQVFPYRYPPKEKPHPRSAQILRKNIAKTSRSRRHKRSIPPIMKNVRYTPNTPTETRTIPARTQSTQTKFGTGDDRPAPEYSYLNCPKPAAAVMPRRSGFLGWMRWSPEDGEGGLRRVLLPRPLVRRKATIKSTGAMRYSSLKKAKQTNQANRRFLIIKKRKSLSKIG